MRRLLLLLILSGLFLPSVKAQMPSTSTPRIIYVYDALCGWSYGFSPVMEKLYNRYKNGVDFDVVSGGLVVDERIGPIGLTAYGIKDMYPVIEDSTGIVFGEEFIRKLDEGSMQFTSLPAAVAMAVFRMYQPEKVLEYALLLENAIYFEGMPPAPYDGYAQLASTFGIDADAFLRNMKKDMIAQQGYAEFVIAYDLEVRQFPAVFLKDGTDLYLLSYGYTDYETLSAKLEEVLAEIKEMPAPDSWYDEH